MKISLIFQSDLVRNYVEKDFFSATFLVAAGYLYCKNIHLVFREKKQDLVGFSRTNN